MGQRSSPFVRSSRAAFRSLGGATTFFLVAKAHDLRTHRENTQRCSLSAKMLLRRGYAHMLLQEKLFPDAEI